MNWWRLQLLAGSSITSPISQFWELGNLTATDPQIPNKPLEANITMGWFAGFESKRWPLSPLRLEDRWTGSLNQTTVAPTPPPEIGWLTQFIETKFKPRTGTHENYFRYPYQFVEPNVPPVGWFMQWAEPRRRPLAKRDEPPTFVVAPQAAPSIGWLVQFDQPKAKKLARQEEASAFVAPASVTTPQNFGWFTSFEPTQRRKFTRPSDDSALVPAAYVAAQAPSFGWYVPFGENKAKKANPTSEIVTPIVPVETPRFGWYVQFSGNATRRKASPDSWAFTPREIVTGPTNNSDLNATDPQDLARFTIVNWLGGGGLDPWLGAIGYFGQKRPIRPVEDDIVVYEDEGTSHDFVPEPPPFVPIIAKPREVLRYPENKNMLLESSDDQIIIDLLL